MNMREHIQLVDQIGNTSVTMFSGGRELAGKATPARLDKHSLLHIENLTLPSFQVIVVVANMECPESKKKVSQLVSKMEGLEEYTMDLQSKEVTMRGKLRWSCLTQVEENRLMNDIKEVCRQLLCLIRIYVKQRSQQFKLFSV